MSLASSGLPIGRLPLRKNSSSRSASAILLRRLSSMLMRSMPSVYSPMRGSGITTSSFTLKALVCLLMAAVRLRSSQNFLRASALTATKPSPARVRRHLVNHPAAARDQPVAAFLLDARKAGEELVGHVLAEAFLAEDAAGDVQLLGALQRLAGGVVVAQLEVRDLHVMDLAHVV